MPTTYEAINRHYGGADLATRLLAALEAAGLDTAALSLDDLAPFDQLHIRGRDATRELAQLAGLQNGMRVLDVGSGLGGAARTLASAFGCQVTGIDLTEEFCRAAEALTARTGLGGRVAFQHGDALEMPFDDGAFDVVWTIHATSHIQDKERLLGQMRRVLRPGGRLALYDTCTGPGGLPSFPSPGSSGPETYFSIPAEAYRRLIPAGGFAELSWADDTAGGKEWFRSIMDARARGDAPPPGFEVSRGPDWLQKLENGSRNIEDDRVVVIQALFERAEEPQHGPSP